MKGSKLHSKLCGCVSGVKRIHPYPVYNFASFGPVLVVFGSGKIVKIGSKHLSAVMMGNDKNYTPISGGLFRVQNQVIRARFSTLLARGLLGGVRAGKFDRNIFQLY